MTNVSDANTGHDHHDHSAHDHTHGASEKTLAIAAALTGCFMVAEVVGGIVSGSLALLADAGHMVTDFASLVLAWFGFRMARRPANANKTYGFDRFTILAAFTNGIALFAVAAWIVVEAWHRLQEPTEILGPLMLAVAVAGFAVNLLVFWILQRDDSDSLNIRAAALHVVGDLLGSVAAIGAAIVIMLTGWMPIDPILSVVVALIILRSAWRIVKESGHILLEGTPAGLDTSAIGEKIVAAVPAVEDVHHIHAWSITEKRHMITMHARVSDMSIAPEKVSQAIKALLKSNFDIAHATVELEYERCADSD